MGNQPKDFDRGSLLLRFDPLLGQPVPTNTFEQAISEEKEEDLIDDEKESELLGDINCAPLSELKALNGDEPKKSTPEKETCDEKMSLVISNAMKDITIEDKLNAENNIMSAPENESKMSELEKKAKNEV